jgi:hypothetical protein
MKSDPKPIPGWALDSAASYPCPCGRPLGESFAVVKGEKGMVSLYHPECMSNYINLGEQEEDV